jgi:hypothetical protein
MGTQRWIPLAVLLAGVGLATASEKSNEKADDDSQPVVSLAGCLQATAENDVYVLQTRTKDVELRGSTTLKEHVGQQVTATGVWIAGRSDLSGKEKASTKDRDRHMVVAAVRETAETCEAE